MNQPLKAKQRGKTRILVAPLDWGLGHATRCIPIIRELLAQDCEVWLAGEGIQKELLETEFPQLPFLQLDGYRIRYARSAVGLLLGIFRQTHKIISAIKKENAWLKKMIAEYDFDAVISDNRYGLYHKNIPCIFITHQLNIKSPLGKWTEKILRKRNYKYINRFTECWVPDEAGKDNLAGELSHPGLEPDVPIRYIGLLSRLSYSPPVGGDGGRKNHLLIILSGPEPQRSILEDKIIQEIGHYIGTATVVRGLPGSSSLIPSTNMIHFYNHLPARELNDEMLQAEYVIARSGYSTVMDAVALQKKTILIPTPGQTEQEYLAGYLLQKKIACCVPQKQFTLSGAIAKAKEFVYHFPSLNNENKLQDAVASLIFG